MKPEPDFLLKAQIVAGKRFPQGVPEPPAWFPADVLERLTPASQLLIRMVAADGTTPATRNGRGQWSLVFLWIGLETGDKALVEGGLDSMLGTSGRGWLFRRLKSLHLSLEDVDSQLAEICVKLIKGLVGRRAMNPPGYVYSTFSHRVEDLIDALQRERERDLPIDPSVDLEKQADADLPQDLEIAIRAAMGLLADREREVLDLFLAGLKRNEIAERLEIGENTVKTHLYRARKKIRSAV